MQAAVNCAVPRARRRALRRVRASVCCLTSTANLTPCVCSRSSPRVEAALARGVGRANERAGSGSRRSFKKGPDGHKADDALVRLSDSVYRESVGQFQMVHCHNSLDFLKPRRGGNLRAARGARGNARGGGIDAKQ